MNEDPITYFGIDELVTKHIAPLVPTDIEKDKISINGLEFEEVELCSWSDIVEKIKEQEEITWKVITFSSEIESDRIYREVKEKAEKDILPSETLREKYVAEFEKATVKCISDLLVSFGYNLGRTIATIIRMVGYECEYVFYSKPLEPRNEKYGEMDGVTHLFTLFKNGLYVNVDCMQHIWDFQYTARILLGIKLVDPLSELIP